MLRNANGKWHRDSLKGMMDTPPGAVHMGMLRFGANQQMQDSLRAQARAFDYAYGGVAALSPFPANIKRYRGYYSRQLQQQQQQQPEPEQAAAPLSPQAQQLQEERQQAAGLEAGTTGFTGAATAPSLLQQQQQQQEQQHSCLAALFLDHQDCASIVLDFLDSRSALDGIGTTARGLRAAVKGSLLRFAMRVCSSRWPRPLPLREFTRLRHLVLRRAQWVPFKIEEDDPMTWMIRAGLNSRLESLRIDAACPDHTLDATQARKQQEDARRQMEAVMAADWPRLRLLDVGRLGGFLEALEKRAPAAATPFPALRSLAAAEMEQGDARRLLALMDRGALPALTAVMKSSIASASYDGFFERRVPLADRDRADDERRDLHALLERLPETGSLFVDNNNTRDANVFAPFATLITSGGLSCLK